MAITKIQIRNFRSILSDEIQPKGLNLIVGPNDVGKSNYLRALNLFFNNQTELNVPLNWKTDYSHHAESKKGKAEQITISITFAPPISFSSRDPVVWKKSWRKDSSAPYRNDKVTVDGKILGGRQKLDVWLERTKYKYVPAIKGPEYFRTLLRDLHDTLALTIDESLRTASTSFLDSLRTATEGISKEVKDALQFESKLQLPSSLGNFFEVLDFETSSAGGRSISLQQRGDGVKARHIPAILKFLADQESVLAAKGKPRVTTIWGYEEPENNLELMASFEAARNFRQYSNAIQTFVTTHSPAFYSLASGDDELVGAWNVILGNSGTALRVLDGNDFSELDNSLGLMQLVSPYVAKSEERARTLKAELESAKAATKPIVFVGGPTDAKYLQKAVGVLRNAGLLAKFEIKFIGTSKSYGDIFSGDNSLRQTLAFLRSNNSYSPRPTLVLFDCDAKHHAEQFGNVRTYSIPQNPSNSKMKRGVENLLPESAFVSTDYTTKTTSGEYGEEKTIQNFEKTKCCNRLCSGDILSAETKKLFNGFENVICEIEAWIDSWPPPA